MPGNRPFCSPRRATELPPPMTGSRKAGTAAGRIPKPARLARYRPCRTSPSPAPTRRLLVGSLSVTPFPRVPGEPNPGEKPVAIEELRTDLATLRASRPRYFKQWLEIADPEDKQVVMDAILDSSVSSNMLAALLTKKYNIPVTRETIEAYRDAQ